MFEEMWDENDLEFTENRLRVHVLTLKRQGDPYPLMRLYGPLGLCLAKRGNQLGAQDAMNDAEFLIVEHGWRGTEKEAWSMCGQALTMQALGRPKFAARALKRAKDYAGETPDQALLAEIASVEKALQAASL